MTNDITDGEAFAVLAIHALNELFTAGECCPECCWPCEVLKELSDSDRLNAILAQAPKTLDLNDFHWVNNGAVDRELLDAALTRTSCHEEGGEGGSVE